MNIVIKRAWKSTDEGFYSFVNPYSLIRLYKESLPLNGLKFYVDGGLLVKIFRLLLNERIERVSFDYSSIAGNVFENLGSTGKKIAIIGSDLKSLDAFKIFFLDKYDIKNEQCYFRDGYFDNSELDSIYKDIEDFDCIVCGMGAVLQERFLMEMQSRGYNGLAYTCGGFIHQTALSGGEYYPDIVDKLGVRWAYRIFKEKNLWKRYFIEYPVCVVTIFMLHFTGKLHIQIMD